MNRVVFSLFLGGSLLVSGCASSTDEIQTAYVSPLQYDGYSCEQIATEMQHVSNRVTQVGGQVDDNAQGDDITMGVGLVLFWPALFFIDGDGPEAQEYARLKGEYEALHTMNVRKSCGLNSTVASKEGLGTEFDDRR